MRARGPAHDEKGERRFYEAGARRPRRADAPAPALPRPLAAWLDLPWRERFRWLGRKAGEALPGTRRIASADRALLENRFLAGWAADPAIRSLLFVGCEWYTHEYAAMFGPERSRFRTIDVDPTKARYGAAGHLVAPLQDVAGHVAPASVDVVVCNGVYGWGIDDRDELARAFAASHRVLRAGGTLLLGWNDVPALAPFDPSEVAFAAGFAADERAGDGWRVRTDTPTRHTFDLYVSVGQGGEAATTLTAR